MILRLAQKNNFANYKNRGNNTLSQDSNNGPLVNSIKNSRYPINDQNPLTEADALKSTEMVEKRINKEPKIIPFSPESKIEWLPQSKYFDAIYVQENKADVWKI